MIEILILGTALLAGEPGSVASFEPPVQLRAGDKVMGEKVLYPSPVMHDVTGDKKADMVIGDLIGQITVSERSGEGWTAPQPLKGADGQPLKFNNW